MPKFNQKFPYNQNYLSEWIEHESLWNIDACFKFVSKIFRHIFLPRVIMRMNTVKQSLLKENVDERNEYIHFVQL